jgi:hypothetical protein
VWAYDGNDLIAAKNGRKKYWTWSFSLPGPVTPLTGATYDPATGRLFLSQSAGDHGISLCCSSAQPVIHVFTIR